MQGKTGEVHRGRESGRGENGKKIGRRGEAGVMPGIQR
jgi:hypothetical protein